MVLRLCMVGRTSHSLQLYAAARNLFGNKALGGGETVQTRSKSRARKQTQKEPRKILLNSPLALRNHQHQNGKKKKVPIKSLVLFEYLFRRSIQNFQRTLSHLSMFIPATLHYITIPTMFGLVYIQCKHSKYVYCPAIIIPNHNFFSRKSACKNRHLTQEEAWNNKNYRSFSYG